jgi:hypothetical protein
VTYIIHARFLKIGLSFSCACFYRKSASLGEMIQQLTPLGVDVPGGFAVSSDAYDAVLDQNGLRERLQDLLEGLDGKRISFDIAPRFATPGSYGSHVALPRSCEP